MASLTLGEPTIGEVLIDGVKPSIELHDLKGGGFFVDARRGVGLRLSSSLSILSSRERMFTFSFWSL